MKQKIKTIAIAAVAVLGIGMFAAPVYAADCDSAKDCVQSGLDATGGTGSTASVTEIISTISNVLLFILGALAVIMIIIGGIRYVTSQGDSSAVTSAKNTILYSVVGLVVALLAYAVVQFVISQLV